MKSLIVTITLLFSSYSYSCPSVQGTWKNCSVSSSLLNSLEIIGANIALKTLTFELSNPSSNTLRSKIIKDTIFSAPETILDEVSILERSNKSVWDGNVFEDSTPPRLTVFLSCSGTGMTENITWDNLSVSNYPDHAKKNYPKYFRSVYSRSGNKLIRKIYTRQTPNSGYVYVAKITCEK